MPPTKKESISDLGLFVARVGFGVSLAFAHGLGKITHFSERANAWFDPFNLGHRQSYMGVVAAEFFCALFLAMGLFGRLAALAVAFSMGITVFMMQKADPWSAREIPLLYFFAAATLTMTGPGRFSLDRMILNRLRRGGKSSAPPPRPDDAV